MRKSSYSAKPKQKSRTSFTSLINYISHKKCDRFHFCKARKGYRTSDCPWYRQVYRSPRRAWPPLRPSFGTPARWRGTPPEESRRDVASGSRGRGRARWRDGDMWAGGLITTEKRTQGVWGSGVLESEVQNTREGEK